MDRSKGASGARAALTSGAAVTLGTRRATVAVRAPRGARQDSPVPSVSWTIVDQRRKLTRQGSRNPSGGRYPACVIPQILQKHGRNGSRGDMCGVLPARTRVDSLDNFVRPQQERGWDGEAEGLGRFHVDD